MKIRVRCLVMALAVLSTGVALAQDSELPLKNWTAPPYWTPPGPPGRPRPTEMQASAEGMTASAQSLPSAPLPFVAIAPCRIIDTRVPASAGFPSPSLRTPRPAPTTSPPAPFAQACPPPPPPTPSTSTTGRSSSSPSSPSTPPAPRGPVSTLTRGPAAGSTMRRSSLRAPPARSTSTANKPAASSSRSTATTGTERGHEPQHHDRGPHAGAGRIWRSHRPATR